MTEPEPDIRHETGHGCGHHGHGHRRHPGHGHGPHGRRWRHRRHMYWHLRGRNARRLWHARAHLRVRIFLWFGVAIALAVLAAGGILDVSDGRARTAALIVAGVVLWMSAGAIAWSVTRPLMALIRVTRDIGAGKLDSRLKLGRHGGELGVMADAVNDMAARIERQLAEQRELLATVSHELRTPLGHMRILVDTAREQDADPGLMDQLEHEIVELDALVGQLLATSRLDFEALVRKQMDAAEVAGRALERAGLAADLLEVEAEDTGCEADPTLLLRALSNVLRNARDHGQGATRLRVRAEDEALIFEVEDAGPGFASADLDQVFERFYRGEHRAGGSLGLGLSLVSRIARAHGGRAWAENLPGGGARVGFSLTRA